MLQDNPWLHIYPYWKLIWLHCILNVMLKVMLYTIYCTGYIRIGQSDSQTFNRSSLYQSSCGQ